MSTLNTFDALLAKYGPARLNEIDHFIHERNSPPNYIERLRLEVLSVERYLQSLKARLNKFSPLLHIPPEILQEIVLFASAIEPGGRAGNGGLGWMKLTHLCRAIRTSILQMRAVWAGVVLQFPGALEELAKRAGDVPLTLDLDERFSASNQLISSDAFNYAYARIFQAKRYELREGSRSLSLGQWWMEVASSISGREFPFLEYLCVDVSPQRSANGDTMIYDAPPIITPRLRALCLENAWIPFSPTTLVSLGLIRSYRPAEETLPSTSLFLDLMRQCTSLQELSIIQCIPQLPILTRGSATGAIQLPSLTVLDVWGPLTKVLAFWSYLDVPKSAYLNMGCDCFIVRSDATLLDNGHELVEPYPDPRRMDLMRSFGAHLDETAIAGASLVERPDSMFSFELWTRSSDPQYSDKAFRPDVAKNNFLAQPCLGVAQTDEGCSAGRQRVGRGGQTVGSWSAVGGQKVGSRWAGDQQRVNTDDQLPRPRLTADEGKYR
ncbi:hypothetical protein PENSPDRAFT_751334 [Peniophora sp. CONT]|nr:hypothetical protein PENSPDRAFT_751334 [Peniophora sp. CONT]